MTFYLKKNSHVLMLLVGGNDISKYVLSLHPKWFINVRKYYKRQLAMFEKAILYFEMWSVMSRPLPPERTQLQHCYHLSGGLSPMNVI